MVLCYSRMMYVEFTVSQTMEHFLACHQMPLNTWRHSPQDHGRQSQIGRAQAGTRRGPVLNPKYADFAAHNGFRIVPCNVGKGNEKGRVENGVGYVKKTSWPVSTSRTSASSIRPPSSGSTPWPMSGFMAKPGEAHRPLATGKPYLHPLPVHPFDHRHRVTG